jgi:hypothetical protein
MLRKVARVYCCVKLRSALVDVLLGPVLVFAMADVLNEGRLMDWSA